MGAKGLGRQVLPAMALMAGLMAVLPAMNVQAQPAPQAGQRIEFNLPAQDLNRALLSLADRAGIQIVYDSAKVQGLRSTAVSGSLTLTEALARMLEGTGYTYSQTAPGRISLVEAPRGGGATLPTISVEGRRTTDLAQTENTGSYTADVATVGGKGATAIRDIPQSVSVVTRQRMDDQNITTLDEAMKQTTGMSVSRFDGAGNFNTIQARGFDVDNVMLDGVNMSTNGNLATSLDTAMYDRIEVLRGPAGLFQGSGEPAGVINLVRKRAGSDLSYGGGLQAGSWEQYRAEGDITSKLVENGRVRGRLVALTDERDSFVDILTSHKKFFYGTVEFDLTPDTTLSVGGASQEVDSVLDQGLPAFADGTLAKIRRSTFIGARWNQLDTDTQDLFADLEHRFGNGGTAKVSLHQFDRSMLYYGYRANGAINTATGNLNMASSRYDLQRKDTSLDAHVNTPFEAWGLTHNVTLGTDYRTFENRGLSGTGGNITTNIYNPVHDVPLVNIPYTSQTRAEQEQYGLYGQLRVKPVQWATLIGGARLSSFNTQNHNLLTGLQTGSDAARGKLTPYGGVVFDMNEQVSLYGSYAEIFSPQTATTVGGTFVPARTGEQYEVGVKGSFAGGKANTHFALFQINDTNRAISDPNNSGFSISGGEIETRGAEAEISGSPVQGLELLAGYSYVISEFLNRAAIQATATHTPKHTLDLWAKYTFQEPLLKGWFVGAGMRAVSSYYSQSGALRFTEDGHAVFNALVGYQFTPDITATLAVTNLLDEEYYEKVSSASRQNFYGEPRAAVLSLKAKW